MGVEEKALELTGLIYDAALAPEKWPAFMQGLATALGLRSAMLRELDYTAGSVGLFETVGFDPAYADAYREHFIHLDCFAPFYDHAPIGAVLIGDEFIPWERQRKTEFCKDFMLAQNLRHVMGAMLARDERHYLQFGLQRELRQRAYDEEDRRLVQLLSPHVAWAVQISHKVSEVTAQSTGPCPRWIACGLA